MFLRNSKMCLGSNGGSVFEIFFLLLDLDDKFIIFIFFDSIWLISFFFQDFFLNLIYN